MKRFALLLVLIITACKSSESSTPAPAGDPEPTQRAPEMPRNRVAPALPGEAPAPAPDMSGRDRPALPEGERPWGRGRDRIGKMDTDGDGKVSDEERAAAMKQRAETMHAKLDTNGDGKVTVDEIKQSPGRMRFDDPATLDTNKDGDISADEISAAMQARRDTARVRRAEKAGEKATE